MCLKNSGWRLRAFEVNDSVEPILSGTTITAFFHGATIGGSGGCNTYGADVTFDTGNDGAIEVSNLISTKMFCPDPPGVTEQESKYFEFLNSAKTFSCTGNRLRLTDGTPTEERALSFDLCQTAKVVSGTDPSAGEAGRPVSCKGVETRDWYAWNNKMPPKPDDFHIVGEVEVVNPGIEVSLIPLVPQGINPRILLMGLHLRQLPGIWPQVLTSKQVRYDKVMVDSDYESVTIFCGGDIITSISVETIQ
ncbi:MAG: META domain-containing protein [bacterium]|nr:META domain-containing protein [bacterium]